MILYHTSIIAVQKPDISFSRDFLDFGKGFYLTCLEDQAIRYGERFIKRGKEAWLNIYNFEYNPEQWKDIIFDSYDKDWLVFISDCRAGRDTSDYDIVIGGVANDKVIQTLDRYFNGEISAEIALGLLRFEKPNNQFCIRSQAMIDSCINYLESRKL